MGSHAGGFAAFSYGPDDYERGVSLERIDPDVPAEIRENWAPSADPSGATPGVLNSVYEPDTTPVSILLAEYYSDTAIDVYFSEPIICRWAQQQRPWWQRLMVRRCNLLANCYLAMYSTRGDGLLVMAS